MRTEPGEHLVGAYLRLIEGCEIVDYNVRPPGGGLHGLSEFDVVGLNLKARVAFLCEVTTHIRGLQYGDGKQSTLQRIKEKHVRQKDFGKKYLGMFPTIRYMFWSPVVRGADLVAGLGRIRTLKPVINQEYTARMDELMEQASRTTGEIQNPAFRVLQILAHTRRPRRRNGDHD